MDDFDFVDVEGDMEGEVNRKKKDVLEEGKMEYYSTSFYFVHVVYLSCLIYFSPISQTYNSPVKMNSTRYRSAQTNIPNILKWRHWS